MATVYSQIEETINQAKQELEHLYNEQKELRKAEKDIPRESYIKEDTSLREHIAKQQQTVDKNQNVLNAYNSAKSLIIDLGKLRELYEKERDSKIRSEIQEEIDAKENELQRHRGLMSEKLQEELRQTIMNELNSSKQEETIKEQTTEVQQEEVEQTAEHKNEEQAVEETSIIDNFAEIERLKQELEIAQRQVQTSIDKMRAIYSSTQAEVEEGEWTKTTNDFNVFVEQYIEKMRAEDAIYIEAQKRVEALKNQIAAKQKEEKQAVERARLEAEAKKLNITFEQYQQIVRAANNRNIYKPVFEQMGLGEILSKRGRTKEERAKVNAARQEMIERLVEVQQRSTENINIRETIDVLYGTDLSVRRAGQPRAIKTTSQELAVIVENAAKEPKRLVKDPNYKPNYTPSERPIDMPKAVPAVIGPQTTALVPVEQKETGLVVVEPKPTALVPVTPMQTGLVPVVPKKVEKVEKAIDNFKEKSKQAQNLTEVLKKRIEQLQEQEKSTILVNPTVPVTKPVEPKKEPVVTKPPVVTTPKQPEKPTVLINPTVPVKPQPKPVVTKEPEVVKEPVKPKVGLISTIEKITKGLEVTKKDGKAYQASNIKIAEGFKNELSSGNYLYNIVHLVPAIIKVPFQFLSKISGKIRFTKDSKQRIKVMKERIESLTDEELMVIFEEYRGNRVMQERFPSAINILLQEKMEQFVMNRVSTINAQLEADYEDIFGAMMELEAIDNQLVNGKLSKEEKQELSNYRKQILQGRAEQVKRIRANYVEAQKWLSGGLNGFSQDMKAATTKLSIVGKRFAKDQDLDLELLSKEAKLERAEMAAIAEGNDQMALLTFIQAESLLSKETEISNSVFGKRSTGKKYYSPLAEKLDYRDDPFVRDLFTTVAVTSAALSTINAIKGAPTTQEIEAANREIQEAQDFVNQVKDQRGTMREGMEAQGIQGTSTITGQVERGALDANNWGLGTGAYKTADAAGHDFYNQVYGATRNQIQDISQQYVSGTITDLQALEMMRDMANSTQETLANVSEQCIGVFEQYAQTHPNFDLTAVTEAVRYIEQHPDAIANMNNAIVDIQTAAEGLSFTHIQALQQVPNSLLTTIITTASAAALAANVNKKMEKNVKSGKYGNNVTSMVDEYVQDHTAEEEHKQSK